MMIYEMWKKFFKSSPAQVPLDSFARTANPIEDEEGRHTPVVRIPHLAPLNTAERFDQRCLPYWNLEWRHYVGVEGPELPVDPYCDVHSDVVLVADPVEERIVVRLPPVGETPAVTPQAIGESSPIGVGNGQEQAPRKGDSLSPGFRLRARGSATRFLESLASDYIYDSGCGGKTSDSVVREWLGLIVGREAKVHGSHQVVVKNKVGDSEELRDIYLLVERSERYLTVSTRLLSKLLVAATLKPRTMELQLALKAKAVQHAGELGFGNAYLALVLSGTIALAMLPTRVELGARLSLGGVDGLCRLEQDKEMAAGRMPTQYVPGFMGLARYFVQGKLPKEVIVPRAAA